MKRITIFVGLFFLFQFLILDSLYVLGAIVESNLNPYDWKSPTPGALASLFGFLEMAKIFILFFKILYEAEIK